jgi:hypothetical protein
MIGSTGRCSIALAVALLLTSVQAMAVSCPPQLTGKIPPRAPDALDGSQFIRHVAAMEPEEREAAIVAEVLSGNIPAFLRELVPIEVTGAFDGEGQAPVSATLCVIPDYLAIGSDDDFVRMPMNFRSSTRIAREFGFVLPTDRIVDAVHRQADYQFSPQPLKPGPGMMLPHYFRTHDRRIREQGLRDGVPPGTLVAGHKKDVVLSNLLNQRGGRIAIYGWHYRDGTPIQPLSTAHHAGYADYSHGIRLVSEFITIEGERYSIYDVLRDTDLLNGDGAIRNVDTLMGQTSL